MDNSAQRSSNLTINDLNPYCLAHILSFFPVVDRIRLQIVSKLWREACKISLSQLTKLTCFYHLSSSRCVECKPMYLPNLLQVLRFCGNSLTYLQCNGEDYMTDNLKLKADTFFFNLLKIACPNLETLDIEQMELKIDGLRYAAKNYNNLKDLRISVDSVSKSLNDALIQLFVNSKRLSAFRISCIMTSLPTCLEKAPAVTLESLDVDTSADKESVEIIANTVKNCYKLSKLRIECGDMSYESLDPIFNVISENKREENFTSLSILQAENNMQNAMIISTLTKLESLALSIGESLNDSILKGIGISCKLLTSLTLIGSECITDKGLTNFIGLQHLKLVNLKNVNGTFFKSMPMLETIDLTYCSNIKENGIKILYDSVKILRKLKIWNTEINDCVVNLAPKNRENKIPLKVYLFVNKAKDAGLFKQDYLIVRKECL